MYQLYSPILYGFILQFTTNESTASCILEESLRSILSRRKELNASDMSPVVFMRRIVRDKAIDILKKNKEKSNEKDGASSVKFLQIANALSPVHKEVFQKRYYNGAEEREIASELKLSEDEVRQKIRETVRAIRDHL